MYSKTDRAGIWAERLHYLPRQSRFASARSSLWCFNTTDPPKNSDISPLKKWVKQKKNSKATVWKHRAHGKIWVCSRRARNVCLLGKWYGKEKNNHTMASWWNPQSISICFHFYLVAVNCLVTICSNTQSAGLRTVHCGSQMLSWIIYQYDLQFSLFPRKIFNSFCLPPWYCVGAGLSTESSSSHCQQPLLRWPSLSSATPRLKLPHVDLWRSGLFFSPNLGNKLQHVLLWKWL